MTIFTLVISRLHIAWLSLAFVREGTNLVANCGYGRGYSVSEVVDSVRRISGRDFHARICDRRPGDPAAVVADAGLARRELQWVPQYANLDKIVTDAFNWEIKLAQLNSHSSA